jgi:flavodoxin
MKKLAVIYHSAHGHTEHIAEHVAAGARAVAGIEVSLLVAPLARRIIYGLIKREE